VTDPSHAQFLAELGVPHQRITGMPTAFMKLDDGHPSLASQSLEPPFT